MTIQIELNELGLSQENLNELCFIFECDVDNLETRIKPFFIAAAKEYSFMFLGENSYTRGSDIRDYRLYLILSQIIAQDLPLENQISKLFQTTQSESRAMIKRVMAKYQYKIRKEIDNVLISVVKSADLERGAKGYGIVIIKTPLIIDKLNEILGSINGKLPGIKRDENSVEAFQIKNDSIEELKTYFSEKYPETEWGN